MFFINGSKVGLPDLAIKNTGFLVKIEFQINNTFFSITVSQMRGIQNIAWYMLTLKISFVVYLKFSFNWAS